jgi:hypothetical protein
MERGIEGGGDDQVFNRQHQRSRWGDRWPSVDLPSRNERVEELAVFGPARSGSERAMLDQSPNNEHANW